MKLVNNQKQGQIVAVYKWPLSFLNQIILKFKYNIRFRTKKTEKVRYWEVPVISETEPTDYKLSKTTFKTQKPAIVFLQKSILLKPLTF